MGLTKTQSGGLEDQSVTLDKLPHGDGSSDGKFLRANNGADPSFETVSIPAGTTINNNADNRVITGSGTANTLEGEANLTFNGSALRVVANDGGADVNFAVRNTNASGFGAYISGGGTGTQYILRLDNKDQSEKVRFPSTGGITFNGDTATANALDDYEEGTWTPTWAPASGSINTLTAWGNYVKIGRVVHCMFAISANGSSGESGRLDVGGLPFTADVPSANGIRGGGGVAFPGAAQNQNITKVVANGSDLYVLLADNSFLQTNSSGIGFSYNAAQLSGMFTYLTS